MASNNYDFSLRQTLIITGVLLLALYGGILFIYQYMAFEQIKVEFKDRIASEMGARYNNIQENITKQHQRIQFLHTTPPVQGIERATTNNGVDPFDGTKLKRWKSRLATIFEGYLENYPDINQIRYIGMANNGKELVRVERQGTNIKTVPEQRLQSKGDSDYFVEVSKYHPRKIYVSDINLNREYGQIQLPYSPTQRIAMPVFGSNNKIFGMVIINIDADYQIKKIIDSLNEDLDIYILNKNNEFVHHPEKGKSFLFEFDKKSKWENDFEILEISKNENSLSSAKNTITSQRFFYIQKRILLSDKKEGRYLSLIIGVTEETLITILDIRLASLSKITGALLIIVFFLLAIYQVNMHKRLSLARDQAEFKAIVSGSHEGIIAMDKSGIINSWNLSAFDITGFTEQMALGQPVFDLFIHENESNFTIDAVQSVYEKGESAIFECNAINRKGDPIILSVNLSPITLENNTTIGVAALFSDITEQKQIEKEILDLNSSLEEKVASRTQQLEAAKNQAIAASMIKSEFIANVSHEIRTPMNGVLGMLDLLAKDKLSKRQRHQLEMARYSAKNLTHLVNDILDMSKIESGKLEIDKSDFNLLSLLSDISSSLSIRVQAKNLEFILDTSEVKHEHVIGDAMRINQVITNLVGNALKFTQKGEIIVTAQTHIKHENHIILKCDVTDTGKGIAPDKLESLFESFTQENSSITKQFGGTGLGLTISKQLCELMNGSISVTSTPEKGSTFSFQVEILHNKNIENDLLSSSFNNANILLASSKNHLLESIGKQLTKFGCSVQSADSKESFENLLKSHTDFELMFIDINLSNNIISYLENNSEKIPSLNNAAIYILENSKDSLVQHHTFQSLIKPATPINLAYCLRHSLKLVDNPLKIESDNKPELTNPLKGISILVVDDNVINLEVAKGVLEDFEVDISLANSAQACFNEITNKQFDFVLMDCQMPIMDGYTATRKIRDGEYGEQNKLLTIIAMTAHAMTGAKDHCLAAGMNDFIPKPINADFIKKTLIRWLS